MFNRKRKTLADHLVRGLVTGLCQQGGRYSVDLYPDNMVAEYQAWAIGDHISRVVQSGAVPDYMTSGELLNWFRDKFPSDIVPTKDELIKKAKEDSR